MTSYQRSSHQMALQSDIHFVNQALYEGDFSQFLHSKAIHVCLFRIIESAGDWARDPPEQCDIAGVDAVSEYACRSSWGGADAGSGPTGSVHHWRSWRSCIGYQYLDVLSARSIWGGNHNLCASRCIHGKLPTRNHSSWNDDFSVFWVTTWIEFRNNSSLACCHHLLSLRNLCLCLRLCLGSLRLRLSSLRLRVSNLRPRLRFHDLRLCFCMRSIGPGFHSFTLPRPFWHEAALCLCSPGILF